MKIVLLVCILLLSVATTPTIKAEFVGVKTILQDAPEFTLKGLDQLGIQYKGIAYNYTDSLLDVFALSYDAVITQKVQPVQYAQLMRMYSGRSETKSRVAYRDNQEGEQAYRLSDFLPPLMQATNGLHFITQYRDYELPYFVEKQAKISSSSSSSSSSAAASPSSASSILSPFTVPFNGSTTTKMMMDMKAVTGVHSDGEKMNATAGKVGEMKRQTTQLTINCWGTAYDLLLSAEENTEAFTLSLGDPVVAWNVLSDNRNSDLLVSSEYEAAFFTDRTIRNANVRAGDYVLIYHQNVGSALYLDHIAIFIDEDILFERAGAGDNVPFRLNTWASLTKSWIPGVFKFQIRRNRNLSPSSSSQAKVFGLKNSITSKVFPSLQELPDKVADQFTVITEFDDDGKCNTQTYVWMKTLEKYRYSPDGRATLSPACFNKNKLLPDLTSSPSPSPSPSPFPSSSSSASPSASSESVQVAIE